MIYKSTVLSQGLKFNEICLISILLEPSYQVTVLNCYYYFRSHSMNWNVKLISQQRAKFNWSKILAQFKKHTSINVMQESERRRGPTDAESTDKVNLEAKSSFLSVSTCMFTNLQHKQTKETSIYQKLHRIPLNNRLLNSWWFSAVVLNLLQVKKKGAKELLKLPKKKC